MNREKVIKGVECCAKSEFPYGEIECNSIEECPYAELDFEGKEWCISQLLKDALALLKEQEAVEPILKREGRNKNYNDYCCPICDNEVVYEQNFCSECGRPFLWEGR